jgi:hypothetical protein
MLKLNNSIPEKIPEQRPRKILKPTSPSLPYPLRNFAKWDNRHQL